VRVTINYQPDKPTVNNHIYPRSVVENMMGVRVPVTFGVDSEYSISIKDIIGYCTLSLEGEDIIGDVELLKDKNIKVLQFCDWSTKCLADLNNNVIQDGCKLLSVFATLSPHIGDNVDVKHLPDQLFEVD